MELKTIAPKSQAAPSYENLDTPIQYVKGVGPARAETLKKIGIETIEDVLFYFPREHQDRRIIPISQTEASRKCAIRGEVLFIEFRQVGKMLGQARAIIKDVSGTLQAIWFKTLSYRYDVFGGIKKYVQVNSPIQLYGTIELGPQGKIIRVDDYEIPDPDAAPNPHESLIIPKYGLTEGLQEKWLKSLIKKIVPNHAARITDPIPNSIRQQANLMNLSDAVLRYHFPQSWEERDSARERLAFDEFFFLELALAMNRQERTQSQKGFSSLVTKKLLTPFKDMLGYEFTPAQKRAINEIFGDMASDKPMNRLLQGDVGSGKTVVALSAALLAIENNRQVALLAPTEILAEQHYLTISKFFKKLKVKFSLLTASTSKPEREKILKDVQSGKIQLILGTHSILQNDIAFHHLGLVIIDEQHRFGVQQRAKLTQRKTTSNASFNYAQDQTVPDVLIMTATPIPRTLAMTVYGDLDVSVIDTLPPGRTQVRTWIDSDSRAIQWIHQKLAKDEQAYIVFPLVEESEKLKQKSGKTVRAAKAEFDKLRSLFPKHNMSLLHGQMKSEQKKTAMDDFRDQKSAVLVATPVIEVGIDVPNSTVIAIFNPERFGLAQLHQLRGRVGRGAKVSECILVVDDMQDKSKTRLETFCSTLDGFKLAEEDLKLRGPGELLGEAQHGLPLFRVGNLLKDTLLIQQTREISKTLVSGDIALTLKEFGLLSQVLKKRFGHKLKLSQIG